MNGNLIYDASQVTVHLKFQTKIQRPVAYTWQHDPMKFWFFFDGSHIYEVSNYTPDYELS